MLQEESPLISVVIPVRNEAKFFEKCLKSHLNQTLSSKAEIIVIDSGSTDGTLEIARKYPVRLYEIKPEEFSFSGTRQMGVELARGEFVLMTSGDAWTADNKLYEKMLRHFSDEEVMSVKGRQVVWPSEENNPFEYFFVQNKSNVVVKQFSPEEFRRLSPKEQYEASLITDNVITMYRKSALKALPFDGIFGEDVIWAKNALQKGWKLVADLNAVVYHYHHYTFKKYCKRYEGAIFVYRYFNYLPRFNLAKDLGRIFYYLFVKPVTRKRRLYWLFYNLRMSFCKWLSLVKARARYF